MPFHIYPVFVVRVENKNTYCKHCILTRIKVHVYACYTKLGGGHLMRLSWTAFVMHDLKN